MDYTLQKLGFRVRKVIRYTSLYGVRRTLIKVKGQYHMKKNYKSLPLVSSPLEEGGHVGLMGCGNFAFSNIAWYLKRNYGRVIRGAMDVDINRAASLFDSYNLRYYTDDPERIIRDPEINLVYIASNHASHAEYAIRALEAGKNVHIEKPHVVREEQLKRLCVAMTQCKGKVGLGFNRPNSRIGREIKKHLDSQSGPAMLNWFIAGHEIAPEHWYFKEEEGGRVLGNLCHWTDFVFQLIAPENRYPITITPTRAEKSDCDIAVTYVFGDGSIAAITFSAKGHTFEGVRERFAAHRGNVLIGMEDFGHLTVEVLNKKIKVSPWFRDHGHELSIKNSYEMANPTNSSAARGCSVAYVWETADLFLKTRQALAENRVLTVLPFDEARLGIHVNS